METHTAALATLDARAAAGNDVADARSAAATSLREAREACEEGAANDCGNLAFFLASHTTSLPHGQPRPPLHVPCLFSCVAQADFDEIKRVADLAQQNLKKFADANQTLGGVNAMRHLLGSEPTEVIAATAARQGDQRFSEVEEMVSATLRLLSWRGEL